MSFQTIPSDVFYLIVPLISVKEILSLARSCQLFSRRLSKDSTIWSTLYRLHLSETIPPFHDEPKTVKGRYILHMRALMSLTYYDGDLEFASTNGHEVWLRRRFNPSHYHVKKSNIPIMAICNGHVECLRVLLQSNHYKTNPFPYLLEAIKSNQSEVLKLLLVSGFSFDEKYSLLLRKATRRNNASIVTLLLEAGRDLHYYPAVSIRSAVKHDCYASIRAFHTFNPQWGDQLLEEAIRQSNKEVARFLIEEYTLALDVNTAFELACEKGEYHIVISLYYRRRADVNAKGGSALIKAAKGGHPIIVKFLLDENADPSVLSEPYRLLYRV